MNDLRSSVSYVLDLEGVKANVSELGDSLTLVGTEPLRLAALFSNMPGVSWVAAGFTARSLGELSTAAGQLAKRYLRKGDRFSVGVEGTAGVLASDISGIVTSAALDAVKGSRVSNESPRVRFRSAFDGQNGVAGVEVRRGPGGAPTGRDQVACLVSGGIHSSVVAWNAVLQGFRVRLVHARYSEESMRAVARLYSELSYRADPRGLSLEVLEGESVGSTLSRYAGTSSMKVFAGYTSGNKRRELQKVISPLYLMSEERFASESEAMGIQSFDALEEWDKKGKGKRLVRRIVGKRADVSGVLDGIEQ